MINDSFTDENPVESLAAEFAERRRRGEHPSIDEYVVRHPELADEIRAFFPALALVEELKPGSDEATETFAGAASLGAGSPPKRLGDFRILREIGRGGMGVVYEAEQESLARRVALKVLGTPTLLDPQKVCRFHRELCAAANLHHTHIVPVFGVGEEDGLHYYVMQFIPGLSLDEVLEELKRLRARKDGARTEGTAESRELEVSAADVAQSLWTGQFHPVATAAPTGDALRPSTGSTGGGEHTDCLSSVTLPGQSDLSTATDSARLYFRSVARIGEQVAEALDYAHRQGTLHRDIKPSNLLLDAHGTVWVTDFGLAKAVGDDDLTHTGDIVGTIRYMAPERFRGQCDARSDVYALGLTLYELIAFRPAFSARDRHDLIRQITQEEPPRLRRLDPTLPRDMETIVHKAIERDPSHRYATAQQMADDLQRFIDDRPIRARRVPAMEHLARWARRNKGLAASLAAVGLLFLTLAIGSTIAAAWFQHMAYREGQLHQAAEQQSDDLRRKDYVYRLALAEREIDESNVGAAAELLQECPEELRDNFEYRYVLRRAHLDIPRFAGVRGHVVSLDYSPDGKRLFAAEGEMYPSQPIDQSTLVKRDAETGEILGRLPVTGGIRSIDVSPDGMWVAIGIGDLVCGPSVAPSSKGEVVLADARTLDIIWRHPAPGPWWANAVAFSPDGSKILVGYGTDDSPMGRKSGSAEVLARSTHVVLRTLPGVGPDETGFCDVAFHPDGRTVALGSFEHIALCDLESEGPIDVVRASQRCFLYALAFSPDGRYFASAGWGTTIHLWDTKTRKLVRRLNGHQGFVRDLAFSLDGRSIASASEDRSIRLWDVASGDLVTIFHGHATNALSVAWHPGGLLLASGGLVHDIKLWDVRSSRPIVKWHFGWTCGLAFDPTPGHEVLATQGHGESFNDQFRLWNASTGEPIAEPGPWDPASVPSISEAVRARGLEMPVGSSITAAVAWSKDGKYIATLNRQRTIKVRERATGAVVRSLEDPQGITYVLAFTSDGNHLISGGQFTDSEGSKGQVVCWDLDTGRPKWRKTQADWWTHIAVSPDGRRVAVADFREGPLVLLDVTDGKTVATPTLDTGPHFTCCAFDVDGTRLAVGCIDPRYGSNLIKVLDLSTGRALLRLTGHTGTVTDVAFSPDGRRLASGSEDRTIKLWDTARGEEVFTLRGHTEPVYRVAFSPDGNLLASGSNDFTVRVWDARPLPKAGRP